MTVNVLITVTTRKNVSIPSFPLPDVGIAVVVVVVVVFSLSNMYLIVLRVEYSNVNEMKIMII
jgi:hypothetical protein